MQYTTMSTDIDAYSIYMPARNRKQSTPIYDYQMKKRD